MISYEQAQATVQQVAQQHLLDTESVQLQASIGRICAADITAPRDIQPFDNSAMDGFALRWADIAEATPENPICLQNTGLIAAGDAISTQPVAPATCIRMMTGAPIPPKADCVVPFELVQIVGDNIFFTTSLEKHANIRFAGEDFHKGSVVIAKGTRLTATHIMPLATLGIHHVDVFKRPRAVFIATGRELVDDLETTLESGQIYNSNRPYSLAMLDALGVECVAVYTIPDEPKTFTDLIARLIADNSPNIIISSGAVSAGDFDFVRTALEALDAEILFHKVKMRPGKPNLFARLANGVLYFGLPGNPVATAVGLRFFVAPALRAMTGRKPESPVHLRTAATFSKKPGLHMFLKARATCSLQGEAGVTVLEGQASFMVSPFTEMNGWVAAGEADSLLRQGEIAHFYPLLPDII